VKNRYVLLIDVPLLLIAAFGAFAVRFDWRFYEQRPEFVLYACAAIAIKPIVFMLLGMYRRYWRYAGVQDLMVVVIAVTASSVAIAAFILLGTATKLIPYGFSRVVFFTDWLLTLVLTGGLRLAIRVVSESNEQARNTVRTKAARRILIVGAGAAGTMVAREMRRNPQLGMEPVGFLDDDPGKVGKQIAGLRVLSVTSTLPAVVRANKIDSVVIAMPAARGGTVRAILELCNEANVKSQTIPGVFELLGDQVSISRLRNIDIADLLRRSPVDSHEQTAAFVAGQVVLITGAGGSIGSELARQIANASPSRLVLLGHGENSIFDVEAQLRASFPKVPIASVIADVRDDRRLAAVFDRIRPDIVFHAAAHKHVPLMEENPEEAITNNVIGTRNVLNHAVRANVQRLVLVSTDKAVAPVSVMGASKRLAEALVRQAARRYGRAFVVVRFGNVLGSRGSVVHTFRRQIERGGPVTVTHPEMTRFFMTIPEAVHLVLQASGKGGGGELFVLDMGEPVKIVDLVRDLIKLSGFSSEEIPIAFSGRRPGEKLEESLVDPGARIQPTSHPEILQVVGPDVSVDLVDLDAVVCALDEAARRGDRPTIVAILAQVIPGAGLQVAAQTFASSPS
jgi:FlaA1/EpsC-like NDP-sugar epimerase